jgi:hypothetical protein
MLPTPRPAAAQEIVAHPGSARLPTKGAAEDGGRQAEWTWGTGSRSRAYHHGARARSPGATLLRHFLHCRLALPVGGLPLGMGMTSSPTLLVPAPRLPPTPQPSRPTAAPRTVALATITPRADVDHLLAQVAKEASTVGMQSRHATDTAWTPAPKPAILVAAGATSPRPSAGDGVLPRQLPSPAAFLPDSPSTPSGPKNPAPPHDDDADSSHRKTQFTAKPPRFLTAADTLQQQHRRHPFPV